MHISGFHNIETNSDLKVDRQILTTWDHVYNDVPRRHREPKRKKNTSIFDNESWRRQLNSHKRPLSVIPKMT